MECLERTCNATNAVGIRRCALLANDAELGKQSKPVANVHIATISAKGDGEM